MLYTKDKDDAVNSFNLIGAEDNILSTARPGEGDTAEFYTYTKDLRESTINIVGKDGISQKTYSYTDYGETHEKALKKVKKIFVREKDSVVRLSINGEAIETTNEHPFYVQGHGWTNASELRVGDKVRLEDGTTGTVEKAKHVKLDNPVTVYNFEVEDFHTYYVSEQKVLVHNTCAMTEKNAHKKSTEIIMPNKPHRNKTEGHWETILDTVDELKKSGDYSKIYVNKGIRNEIPGTVVNRRPDIMAVRHDGTIDQFEIPSKTDSVRKLQERMIKNQKMMGERAGSTEIRHIK